MGENLSLIKLSTNAWHFKLNRYVYGKNLINTNMRNLCPYFWMLMLAFLLVPIWAFFDFIILRPINFILNEMDRQLERSWDKWMYSLNDVQVADIFRDGDESMYESYLAQFPNKANKMSWEKRHELIKNWALKNLEIDLTTEDGKAQWENFIERVKEKRNLARMKAFEEKRIKDAEKERKLDIKRQKEEDFRNALNSIAKPFNWFFRKLKAAFTFNTTAKIVKTAKHVIGAIITAGLTVGLFFIVQWAVFIVMLIANAWDTPSVLNGLLMTGIGILVIAIGFLISWGITVIVNNYKKGKKRYYLIDFIIWIATYLIYTPVKILVFYPLYFIFWSFLWKTICVAIIWNSLTSFWKGLMSVTGIFGEYFGRSKGDYCPGIEWKEEE